MGKKNNSSSKGNNATNVNSGTNPEANPTETPEVIPDEFKKVMMDFINDFTTTFPEYSDKLKDNFVVVSIETNGNVVAEEMFDEVRVKLLYEYSKSVYPARFFDILYKNVEIFNKDNTNTNIDVKFLPDIDFKEVWNTPDISDNTRETIWKYLQLILFSIITNVSDRNSFGDTAKLFEAINEDELKNKLEETFKNMQNMFMGSGENKGDAKDGDATDAGDNSKFGDEMNMEDFEKFAEQFKNFSPENMGIDMSRFEGLKGFPGFPDFKDFNFKNNGEKGENGENGEKSENGEKGEKGENGEKGSSSDSKTQPEMPNPEAIHEHISKLLNGKIGALAKEIAEETAKDFDLGIDMENAENINMSNVFQKLFKNPGKLMNMVKNVGKKLDDKFKKGDIKESELMKEASDLLSNMKNMPGMGDLSSMLGKMGMSGLGGLAGLGGKGGKINMGALQNHLQQNMKNAKMKERMQSKLQQKQQQQQQQQQASQTTQQKPNSGSNNTTRPNNSVYVASTGENIQQTPRAAKPPTVDPGSSVSQTNENIILDTSSSTNTHHENNTTGYEPAANTKNKKKKNKNKK
jgi:hypothetical protein